MPDKLIYELRLSFKDAEYVYTNGSCYNLFKILKVVYPQAEAYFNSDHVITKIDGKFYDITGEVECSYDYIPVKGNFTTQMMEKQYAEI